MSGNRICLKGAVVIGLIAALSPGLWAQSLHQQQTVTPPVRTDVLRSPTEAQRTAVARGPALSDKVSPGIRAEAPPTQEAQGGLIWFTDQAEFEAFAASQGMFSKGSKTTRSRFCLLRPSRRSTTRWNLACPTCPMGSPSRMG